MSKMEDALGNPCGHNGASLTVQPADIDIDGARFGYRFDGASEVAVVDQLLIRQAGDSGP